MYESSEALRRLAIDKQRQLIQEAEVSRLIAKHQRARPKRTGVSFFAWLGQCLIKTGEWMLQYANHERRNVHEHIA